jgi:pimeloyl-ACP methyl ester carboxylesterase
MARFLVYFVVVLLAIALLPPLAADLFDYRADPELVPSAGRRVDVGEGRFLQVVEQGAGPDVVLVHGLPGTAADWAGTPAALANLGHHVVAYDRVGYGHSSREPEPTNRYTYRSNAEDLLGLLDALGLERPVLVGWSYGGAVAQTFAQEHPDRVSALVLIGAVGPAEARAADEGGVVDALTSSAVGNEIFDWLGSVPPLGRAVTRGVLVDAFSNEQAIPEGWVDYTRAALELPGTFQAFVQEVQRNDPGALQPQLLDLPALVLHGTEDRLVPYAVGEDLDARLPRSKLETVFGGSHMLPVTHPELVAKAIHELSVGAYILDPAVADPTAAAVQP